MKSTITPVLYCLSIVACVVMSCHDSNVTGTPCTTYVPNAPDYMNSEMWHIQRNDCGGGADVFYIPSTWEYDWTTPEGIVCHYADPSLEKHRADMNIEITGVAEYMADGNNFYSPYYRHVTLDTWATLNEDTIARRYHDVSFIDIQSAFNHYMNNYNDGRPFILAGFSQGGKSVVELMKTLTPGQRERMIASYVLGYKVTPDDVAVAPWIKGARGAEDTGVTICYNSVADVTYIKPIVSSPNLMCINPVNWTTGSTPGILNDTITVTLATDYNVLVVDGYDGSSLPNILDILNTGDYHGAEPWLYSDCLHKNFRQRIESFRNKTNKQ